MMRPTIGYRWLSGTLSEIRFVTDSEGEFTHLEANQLFIDDDILGQEVCTDSSLVLIGEAFVHVLIHQRGLPDSLHVEQRDCQ